MIPLCSGSPICEMAGLSGVAEREVNEREGLAETRKKSQRSSSHTELVEMLAETPVPLNAAPGWNSCMRARVENLKAAVSTNTGASYSYWWSRYEDFCTAMDIPLLPFSSCTASMFLSKLAEDSEGMGGVEGAKAAMRYYWNIRFPSKPCPADSAEVRSVVGGIKRRFKKPAQKSAPISVADFQKVLDYSTENGELEEANMSNLRFAAQVSLMFCTFARFEEVRVLTMKQVKEDGAGLTVDFLKGKQYQYGECRMGAMPSQEHLRIDPVQVVKVYMRRLKGMGAKDDDFMFPKFAIAYKSQRAVFFLSQAATYECVRKQLKLVMNHVKGDGYTGKYGLHSFRRGAATGASNNGCDEHTIRKQMRVGSVSTVHRYASLSNEKLKDAPNKLFGK